MNSATIILKSNLAMFTKIELYRTTQQIFFR